jgi:hypothetical protein
MTALTCTRPSRLRLYFPDSERAYARSINSFLTPYGSVAGTSGRNDLRLNDCVSGRRDDCGASPFTASIC